MPVARKRVGEKSTVATGGSSVGRLLLAMKSPMKCALASSRSLRAASIAARWSARPGWIARIKRYCRRSSDSIGAIATVPGRVVTEPASRGGSPRVGAGAMRRPGSRRGMTRSTAATIRFSCEIKAKHVTTQIRGSAGPEKIATGESSNWRRSKSSAISIAVASHSGRWVTLICSKRCRAAARSLTLRQGVTARSPFAGGARLFGRRFIFAKRVRIIVALEGQLA